MDNLKNLTDIFFEQAVNISKAHAYDIVVEQVKQLEIKNKLLQDRVKFLEDLIIEYTEKIKSNLK